MENREAGRSLSLIVSSLILMYHAANAYLCTYLPSDPLYVSLSVTGYAWYGCVLSLLGIAGSLRRSPTLLTVFSNHLLIDTVLSLVPKIGLLYLFHDLTSDLCLTSISTSFWLPTEDSFLHGPGRVMVPAKSNNSQDFSRAMTARKHCEVGISVARVILLAILVLWTTAQWGLGLYIRRYAVRLDINDRMAQRGVSSDEEKASYKDDAPGDMYQDHVKAVDEWSRKAYEKQESLYHETEVMEKEEEL